MWGNSSVLPESLLLPLWGGERDSRATGHGARRVRVGVCLSVTLCAVVSALALPLSP